MLSNRSNENDQVPVLSFFLIKNNDVPKQRMVFQETFISLTHQEVNSGIRVMHFELLYQWSSQDNVSDKCGLNDEEFQNESKL